MARQSTNCGSRARAPKPGRRMSDAARRPAGLLLPDGIADAAGWLRGLVAQWAVAEVAPGRLMPWLPVAFGFGIVAYFTADREPAWWAAIGVGACGHRGRRSGTQTSVRFSARARVCCDCAGALRWPRCRRVRIHASDFAASDGERARSPVLSRSARSARRAIVSSCASSASRHLAPRGCRIACAWRYEREAHPQSAASSNSRRVCRRRCSHCGPAVTILRATCISSASALPAMCSVQIKVKAPPVAGGFWLRYATVIDDLREAHRQAHARNHARGQRLDRLGTHHGKTRCDINAGQRRDVHFKSRACAVDFRLSHGGRRRHRIFLHPCRIRPCPVAGESSSDKEMGGIWRAVGGNILSSAFRRRSRYATFLHHDCDRARRRDAGSANADVPHNLCRGDRGPYAGAASGRASKFSDVICGNAGADCGVSTRASVAC